MPLDTNGNYAAPTWVNDNEPAIDADELNAMSGAIAGAVEYDREMDLSPSDKKRARANIGAEQANKNTYVALSNAWAGEEAPYTQTITVENAASGKPTYIALDGYNVTEAQYDEWMSGKIVLRSVGSGTVTIAALGTKPGTSLPINVTIFEP